MIVQVLRNMHNTKEDGKDRDICGQSYSSCFTFYFQFQ